MKIKIYSNFKILLTLMIITMVAIPSWGIERQEAREGRKDDSFTGGLKRTRSGDPKETSFPEEEEGPDVEVVSELSRKNHRLEEQKPPSDDMEIDAMAIDGDSKDTSLFPEKDQSLDTPGKKEGSLSEEEMINDVITDPERLKINRELTREECNVKRMEWQKRREEYSVSFLKSPSIRDKLLQDKRYRRAFLELNIIEQVPECWYQLLNDQLCSNSYFSFRDRLFKSIIPYAGYNIQRGPGDISAIEKKMRDKLEQDANQGNPQGQFFLALLTLDRYPGQELEGSVPKARALLRAD